MKIIAVINAKGGCGKSTLAMSLASGLAMRGLSTLLIDMDPQSQLTQWLGAGDGLSAEGTLVAAMTGQQALAEVIQPTQFEHLSFIASSEALEEFGRQITEYEDYTSLLSRLLQQPGLSAFEYVVIDSPNQISPVMENAILPADLFVVPFESTKAVRSYANLYKLLLKLKSDEEQGDSESKPHRILHVLNNLSRLPGLRKRVIQVMETEGIPPARTEVRSDGWLAQVDEHGGSIFHYRPSSKGAQDLAQLTQEVLEVLNPPVAEHRGETGAQANADTVLVTGSANPESSLSASSSTPS